MDRSNADVLRLINEIYGAGLGERSWTDALRSLTRFFGAPCGVAFDVRPDAGTIAALYGYGAQPHQSDYVDRMNAIDPRKVRALTRRGCFTTYDYEVLPEAAIRRHEFYDWMERDCGIKYHIGSRFIDTRSLSSFVSVNFDAKRGHAEPDEIEMFRFLAPHFANAWRISQRLAQASRIDDFNVLLLENAPWGVVSLDFRGRVLTANGPARRAIARRDGLLIKRGELHAQRSADDRSLQIAIGNALESAGGGSPHPGGTLAVGRPHAAPPYALRVLPMRHVIGLLPEYVPFVAVVISDPVEPGLPSPEDLAAVFGLTPHQANVALLMAQGMTLAEVADRMGISASTARTHLANAMRKTGTHTRGGLIGLVRGLPARDERN